MNNTTIAIIGAGAVGTTTAYALILNNIPATIVLIDTNETRCAGEIMDLSDVTPLYTDVHVRAGTSADAQHADIIIIASGKRQEPGQPRTELLEANKAMLITLINQMQPLKKTALILMVTNPLDVHAYQGYRTIKYLAQARCLIRCV
jgi:L-lactate dehydrogenase